MNHFETKYGHFNADGSEYIITEVKTPKPWVNVISNGRYGTVISQTGGGFSWLDHSEFNRLNRWHQDLIKDDWGKYFYFKNNDTGEIWNIAWLPVKTEVKNYQCKHGLGYSIISSEFKGIKIELTVFVPVNENLEIWDFKIHNSTSQKVNISIFTYFEWCIGSSSDFHREFHKQFIETEFHSEENVLLATKRLWEIPLGDRGHWNIEYPYFGFIASNIKIEDYDGDKESFLGNYGSLSNPKALSEKSLSKKTGKWNDSVAVIKVSLALEGGNNENAIFYLGINENKDKIVNSIKKFNTNKEVELALSEVKKYWDELLSPLEIETPDVSMNILVNKWLRYQAISGRLFGRTAYYQQSGAFGFRDQLQDSLVYLPIAPEKTLEQIKLHAAHQFQDGTVLHWWHPISETGLPTKMVDDLLWLPFLVYQYINETNDYSILNIEVNYYDNLQKIDSIYKHCVAAIDRVLQRISNRGIPLIGAGDWNDGLSAVGLDFKGESVWMAEFFFYVLTNFSFVAKKYDRQEDSNRFLDEAQKVKKAFDAHCWDGNWYFRGTKDSGEKFGSNECEEGKIFLNPQSWAVISEIDKSERSQIAMKSVKDHLLKKNGALLLAPAYSKPDKMIGYLSRYAPGRRENGGVYSHAATWAVWAFAKLGDFESAFEAYKRLNPVFNGMNPDEYIAEPYVMPGNIDGPDSPNYGMGGWTWYTGSASWYQRVIVEWIIGIRPSELGLIVDPSIPKNWNQFKVKRTFRGKTYFITINNPSGLNSGVKRICVNGREISGNTIMPHDNEKIQKVEINLEN